MLHTNMERAAEELAFDPKAAGARARAGATRRYFEKARAEFASSVPRGGCNTPGCLDPDCTIEPGCCHGGCGRRTELVPQTVRKRNLVAGEPRLYIVGHNRTACPGRRQVARDGGGPLRAAREAKGLSQSGLARLAGTSSATVSTIEGTERVTHVGTAQRIADVLEVDVAELFSAEIPDVRSGERTRPATPATERYDGEAKRREALEVRAYRKANDLWNREETADYLILDAGYVTQLVADGRLAVAERRGGQTLFRPADVKSLARQMLKATDRRARDRLDREKVLRREINGGSPGPRAVELADRAEQRRARYARVRVGANPAAEIHARWRTSWKEQQDEFPELTPGELLHDVAEIDWERHPEDWHRGKYPASPDDPDALHRDWRRPAYDRVRKALQNSRKS